MIKYIFGNFGMHVFENFLKKFVTNDALSFVDEKK